MKKSFIKLTIIFIAFLSFGIVKALDEREVITSVEATSDIESILVYGGNIESPTFNISNGTQAQFEVSESSWHRYENGKWLTVFNGYRFNSGKWYYSMELRLDSDEYKLSSQTSVIVNGEEWSFSYCNSCSGTNYSVGTVTSPSYNLEASGDLQFFKKGSFHIYTNYIDTAIYSFSVSSAVEGGTAPYTFSKTSGPEWVNVSADGTISGTPTTVGNNDDLVVRVTDSTSDYKEITIKVDRTALPPALREEIIYIEATSNTSSIPILGENIINPTFNVTNVEGPFFASYNCGWYKKIGSNWELQSSGKFTPGVWQYRAQVILQGESAESYRLSDNTVVMVDGIDWNASLSGVGNEYYAESVTSPEYIVKDYISSIELIGTIEAPKVGNDILEPSIGIESLNNDPNLINYADVTSQWQYKTGEGFFDWKDASGKFEQGKTYHIRLMITINGDVYDLKNIATFPVTLNGYNLIQFQLNNKTVGEFIEFSPLNDIYIPNINIKNDNNKATITWESQSSATKYMVYKSTDGKKYKKVSDVTNNSYVEKSLTYNKTYYYKIKSCDASKCTNYSNVVSKKIKPNKVENLKITSAGTNNIKTAWDKVSVTGYQLQRSTNGKKWSTIKTITKNSTLSYNNKRLSSNKTYYYRVRAYKKVSGKKIYGPWSDIVSTKTAPVKPSLKVTLKDYNSMNIVIGESKGAVLYRLEKSIDGKTYTLFEEFPIKGTVSIEEQEVGKTYYFRLKACNLENRCSSWNTYSLKQTTKVPSLSLKTSSKKVTVTLSSVNGADGYEIYRSTSKRGKYSLVKTLLETDEIYNYENKTTQGKYYYYKVRSYKIVNDKKIYSPYSSIKSIRSK